LNVLIVFAHPERRSFNGAMLDLAVDELTARGHSVTASDLYAMRFWAGAGPDDFIGRIDRRPIALQSLQAEAARTDRFAAEIRTEIDKLMACRMLILQFQLWWFSMPAILKGWIDRVFAYGVTYGKGASLAGRRALVATTTGGPAASYSEMGRGTVESYLKHLLVGTLAFCGMELLPMFVAHGPARLTDAERTQILARYRAHLRTVAL
jgi:NAD(P)H dehydrogenase (quinone)